jgi:hypothetical protein
MRLVDWLQLHQVVDWLWVCFSQLLALELRLLEQHPPAACSFEVSGEAGEAEPSHAITLLSACVTSDVSLSYSLYSIGHSRSHGQLQSHCGQCHREGKSKYLSSILVLSTTVTHSFVICGVPTLGQHCPRCESREIHLFPAFMEFIIQCGTQMTKPAIIMKAKLHYTLYLTKSWQQRILTFRDELL